MKFNVFVKKKNKNYIKNPKGNANEMLKHNISGKKKLYKMFMFLKKKIKK